MNRPFLGPNRFRSSDSLFSSSFKKDDNSDDRVLDPCALCAERRRDDYGETCQQSGQRRNDPIAILGLEGFRLRLGERQKTHDRAGPYRFNAAAVTKLGSMSTGILVSLSSTRWISGRTTPSFVIISLALV